MLQRGDGLSVRCEAPDERRIRGHPFGEDLDGDVSLDPGLDRTEDDARAAFADLLQEAVATQWLTPELEARILPQDPLVEPGEVGRGIHPELVGQDVSGSLEGAQRFGLAVGPVVGQHEEAPQALPQRVVGEQHLQLADGPALATGREQCFHPVLLGLQPEVVEPGRRGGQRGLVTAAGQRRSTPQRQRILENPDGDGGGHRQGPLRVLRQRLEPGGVQLVGLEPQSVPGCAPLNAIASEDLPQVRDIGLDDVPRLLGRRVPPDPVDQHPGRDQLVRPQDQVRQDRPLLRTAQRERPARGGDLQGTQDPELHLPAVPLASP